MEDKITNHIRKMSHFLDTQIFEANKDHFAEMCFGNKGAIDEGVNSEEFLNFYKLQLKYTGYGWREERYKQNICSHREITESYAKLFGGRTILDAAFYVGNYGQNNK